MEPINIRLTDRHKQALEQLVEAGVYSTMSEAVRDAIRKMLDSYEDPSDPTPTWGD